MIDIEILRTQARAVRKVTDNWDTSVWRTVLELIERLEKAEAQQNELQDRLTCMCGDYMDRHPQLDSHNPVSHYEYYRVDEDLEKLKREPLKSLIEAQPEEEDDAHEREEEVILKTGCHDCDRPYGNEHGFPDLVIPHHHWAKISPTGDEGGLLCPSCICKRLHDAGISGVIGSFTSGPIRSVSPDMMYCFNWIENFRKDKAHEREVGE